MNYLETPMENLAKFGHGRACLATPSYGEHTQKFLVIGDYLHEKYLRYWLIPSEILMIKESRKLIGQKDISVYDLKLFALNWQRKNIFVSSRINLFFIFDLTIIPWPTKPNIAILGKPG